LRSKHLNRSSKCHMKIAFYTGPRTNEILYSDLAKYKNKSWMSNHVVDAFFWLLDANYSLHDPVRFGCSAIWSRYICDEEYPLDKLRVLLAMGTIYNHLYDLHLPVLIHDSHWILVVIRFEQHSIEIYDSLDHDNDEVSKLLVNRLSLMFSDKREWHVKNHYRDVSIPRQSDGYSCAYYTCWYAFKLISEGAVGIWADNIESIAKQIFISLIESGLVMLNAFSKKVTRT
jgi:Ulp1 family protease